MHIFNNFGANVTHPQAHHTFLQHTREDFLNDRIPMSMLRENFRNIDQLEYSRYRREYCWEINRNDHKAYADNRLDTPCMGCSRKLHKVAFNEDLSDLRCEPHPFLFLVLRKNGIQTGIENIFSYETTNTSCDIVNDIFNKCKNYVRRFIIDRPEMLLHLHHAIYIYDVPPNFSEDLQRILQDDHTSIKLLELYIYRLIASLCPCPMHAFRGRTYNNMSSQVARNIFDSLPSRDFERLMSYEQVLALPVDSRFADYYEYETRIGSIISSYLGENRYDDMTNYDSDFSTSDEEEPIRHDPPPPYRPQTPPPTYNEATETSGVDDLIAQLEFKESINKFYKHYTDYKTGTGNTDRLKAKKHSMNMQRRRNIKISKQFVTETSDKTVKDYANFSVDSFLTFIKDFCPTVSNDAATVNYVIAKAPSFLFNMYHLCMDFCSRTFLTFVFGIMSEVQINYYAFKDTITNILKRSSTNLMSSDIIDKIINIFTESQELQHSNPADEVSETADLLKPKKDGDNTGLYVTIGSVMTGLASCFALKTLDVKDKDAKSASWITQRISWLKNVTSFKRGVYDAFTMVKDTLKLFKEVCAWFIARDDSHQIGTYIQTLDLPDGYNEVKENFFDYILKYSDPTKNKKHLEDYEKNLENVNNLITVIAYAVQKESDAAEKYLNTSQIHYLYNALQSLRTNREKILLHSQSKISRVPPFVLWFYGDAGTGKSTLAPIIFEVWHKILKQRELQGTNDADYFKLSPYNISCTSKNFSDKYDSTIMPHHDCIIIDDMLQDKTSSNLEGSSAMWLINAVSSTPFTPNYADIARKGLNIEPKMIIATSNFSTNASVTNAIHCEQAFMRRRNIMIKVEKSDSVDNFFNHKLKFQICRPEANVAGQIETGKYITGRDLINLVMESYIRHWDNENQIIKMKDRNIESLQKNFPHHFNKDVQLPDLEDFRKLYPKLLPPKIETLLDDLDKEQIEKDKDTYASVVYRNATPTAGIEEVSSTLNTEINENVQREEEIESNLERFRRPPSLEVGLWDFFCQMTGLKNIAAYSLIAVYFILMFLVCFIISDNTQKAIISFFGAVIIILASVIYVPRRHLYTFWSWQGDMLLKGFEAVAEPVLDNRYVQTVVSTINKIKIIKSTAIMAKKFAHFTLNFLTYLKNFAVKLFIGFLVLIILYLFATRNKSSNNNTIHINNYPGDTHPAYDHLRNGGVARDFYGSINDPQNYGLPTSHYSYETSRPAHQHLQPTSHYSYENTRAPSAHITPTSHYNYEQPRPSTSHITPTSHYSYENGRPAHHYITPTSHHSTSLPSTSVNYDIPQTNRPLRMRNDHSSYVRSNELANRLLTDGNVAKITFSRKNLKTGLIEHLSMNCLRIYDTYAITCRHLFKRDDNYSIDGQISITSLTKLNHFIHTEELDYSKLVCIEGDSHTGGKDIVMYKFDKHLSQCKDIRSRFFKSHNYTENGSCLRISMFPTLGVSKLTGFHTAIMEHPTVGNFNSYNAFGESLPGSSGSAIISMDSSMNPCIMGMQVAATFHKDTVHILPLYPDLIATLLNQYVITPTCAIDIEKSIASAKAKPIITLTVEERLKAEPQYLVRTGVTQEYAVSKSHTSNYEPSIGYDVFKDQPHKVIAAQSCHDARICIEKRGISLIKRTLDKFDTKPGFVRPRFLNFATEGLKEYYSRFTYAGEKQGKLSDTPDNDEVTNGYGLINQVEMRTSSGLPLMKEPGAVGKKHVYEIVSDTQDGIIYKPRDDFYATYKEAEKRIRQGEVPTLPTYTSLKDELLDLEKVQAGKTRTFYVAPLEINLLQRKYLSPFFANVQAAVPYTHIAVGISPQEHFTHIYKELCKHGSNNAFDLDYSNWDQKIPAPLLRSATQIINHWFRKNDINYEPEDDLAREALVEYLIHTPLISGSTLYFKQQGIPSGCAVTASMNSLVHHILIYYAWTFYWAKHDKSFLGVDCFEKNLTSYYYGDDFLGALSDKAKGFLCQETLDLIAETGMTVTSGDKKSEICFKKPHETTFLKRSFHPHPTNPCIIMAQLSKKSIISALCFVHHKDDPFEAFIENARNSLTEAAMWGKPYFDDLKEKCDSVIQKYSHRKNNTITAEIIFPSYDEVIFKTFGV